MTPHCVDLVYEDDRGSDLLCLFKKVTDTACADTHIKLNKVGAGDREELNVCLACNSLGQQSLTGSRRAYEQHALGDAGAHLGIFLGILQEVNDLSQFGLLLVAACHIGKGDLFLFLAAETGARLAELCNAACAACAALRAVHNEHPYHNEAHEEQNIGQESRKPGGLRLGRIIILADYAGLFLFDHELAQFIIKYADTAHFAGHDGLVLELCNNCAALGLKGVHLLGNEKLAKLTIGDSFGSALPVHSEDRSQKYHQNKGIKAQVSCSVFSGFFIQKKITSLLTI